LAEACGGNKLAEQDGNEHRRSGDRRDDPTQQRAHAVEQIEVVEDPDQQQDHEQQRKKPVEHLVLSWPLSRLRVSRGFKCGNSNVAMGQVRTGCRFSPSSLSLRSASARLRPLGFGEAAFATRWLA
jgi:hypothetical protein